MFLKINTKTLEITRMNDREEKDPFEQYKNAVRKDAILISISGCNKKAKEFQNIISVYVYDMKAVNGIRRINFIIDIGKESDHLRFRTNMKIFASPELTEELLPSLSPMKFLETLAKIEELYSDNKDIEHTPFLAKLFERQFSNCKIKGWGSIFGRGGQFFSNQEYNPHV